MRGTKLSLCAAVVAVALVGCGGGASSAIVVSVDGTPIDEATLDHRMSVMAAGREQPGHGDHTLRQRALGSLISSQWLIGEAAEQGHAVTHAEVVRHLGERIRSYPNGEREFHEALKLAGQTTADAMFEIEVELASARVRQLAVGHEAKVTPAEIVAYYDANKRSFATTEHRQVELVHTTIRARAEKVRRATTSGRTLASVSTAESLVYIEGLGGGSDNALRKVIFRTGRGAIAGPIKIGPNYFVFEVTRIIPGRERPLAELRSTIKRELEAQQRERELVAFIKAWRARWIARTDCRPGFVVQKCKQYIVSKSTPTEDPLAFN